MNWAHIRMRTKRPISPGIEGQVGSIVASKTSKSGKEDSEGATAAPFARKAQAFGLPVDRSISVIIPYET